MKRVAIWILLVIIVTTFAFAQGRRGTRTFPPAASEPQNLIERKAQQSKSREYEEVFRSVERGFNENNVGAFSRYFGSQLYVSLPTAEGGYYSGNQAYYILQNYLSGRRIQAFKLNYSGNPDSAPYATGQGRFEVRGSVENIQVYVALSRIGSQWVVTQLTIY